MRKSTRCLLAVLLAAHALAISTQASAQSYPDRPLTLIVPYAAGGTGDTLARLLGEQVGKSLGQPVTVDNKAGGSTVIGTQAVKAAPADGYTILFNAATSVINPYLMPKLTYDIHKDFTPLTLMASNPHILVTSLNVPAGSLPEFIQWANGKKGAGTYASFGTGSSGHLGFELFKKAAKIDMIHVPYKGVAPATTDLLGGQVDAMLSDLPQVVPYVKAGKLKAIAVASESRAKVLPGVPTFTEGGLAGFTSKSWFGLLVRAGTPPDIVTRLNGEFVKALHDPIVLDKLAQVGMDPIASTSAQFGDFMRAESKKYGEAVAYSGARLD